MLITDYQGFLDYHDGELMPGLNSSV